MRAERLLRLLLQLQSRGKSTVDQLADHLDVSHRTVQRDLEALSLAGIPVYSVRGRGGGWALLPDYRTRLTGLTPSEVTAVFVGATAHVLADLGLDASSDLAVSKLTAALPVQVRRDAEFARQRLLVDHAGWNEVQRSSPPWLELCRQAIWDERQIMINYRQGDQPLTVAPLGLVAKGRQWYLVAARADGRRRTFRLDRVTALTTTDRAFDRPADFDLARHWEEQQQQFRSTLSSYPIVLRVRDEAVPRFRPTAPVRPDGAGWSVVEADLENVHEACATVLAQAGAAIVLDPPELADRVGAAARRLVETHPTTGS